MTNPIIKFVDATTGEEIEREMDAKELAQWKIDVANAKAEVESKAAEKAALLAKLGITEDEAKLLLS